MASINEIQQYNDWILIPDSFEHTEVMTYDELVETRQRIMGIGNQNLFYIMLDRR